MCVDRAWLSESTYVLAWMMPREYSHRFAQAKSTAEGKVKSFTGLGWDRHASPG